MALTLFVMVGALVVGRLAGGRVAGLTALQLRRPWLAAAALAILVAGALLAWATSSRGVYLGASAAAVVTTGIFLLGNRSVPGLPLVGTGLVLNLLAVAANGAMPVSRYAAARAGVSLAGIAAGSDAGHVVAGSGTALRALGDVIPVPLPVWPEVVSAGDVLVAAGLGLFVVVAMRRPAEHHGGRHAARLGTVRRRPARQYR